MSLMVPSVSIDLSPTTGRPFYGSPVSDVKEIAKAISVSDKAMMATITEQILCDYMEMVDRTIDGILEDVYYVPLKQINQIQPDGRTVKMYPGALARLARYWSAGLMLQSQFSKVDPNTNEVVQSMIDDAKQQVYMIKRFNMRLQGQEFKANQFGHTCYPTMIPPIIVEPNW